MCAGHILNRFSSDASTVDDSLPFILNILLANVFSALGILAVLLWTQALLILPCIPLFLIYRSLARYYQVSSSGPTPAAAASPPPPPPAPLGGGLLKGVWG